MPLNLFDDLEGIPDEALHPKFKLLRDNPLLTGERNILLKWAEGFEDRDNKIIKEFQTTFHSVLWELFLHELFKQSGLRIDFSKDRPDFIISAPLELYVEAVVSEIKQGGRSENTRGLDDVLSMLEPLKTKDEFEPIINEAITRYSNSIRTKHRKYLENYSKCEWVDKSAPYTVALASYAQINYGKEFHNS